MCAGLVAQVAIAAPKDPKASCEPNLGGDSQAVPKGLQSIPLRNGTTAPRALVSTVMVAMKHLIERKPIIAYELVEKARDPAVDLSGISGQTLQELELLDEAGNMNPDVRNIVLSSAEGDGLEMQYVSPVQPRR
jgi:hypothetical protein